MRLARYHRDKSQRGSQPALLALSPSIYAAPPSSLQPSSCSFVAIICINPIEPCLALFNLPANYITELSALLVGRRNSGGGPLNTRTLRTRTMITTYARGSAKGAWAHSLPPTLTRAFIWLGTMRNEGTIDNWKDWLLGRLSLRSSFHRHPPPRQLRLFPKRIDRAKKKKKNWTNYTKF